MIHTRPYLLIHGSMTGPLIGAMLSCGLAAVSNWTRVYPSSCRLRDARCTPVKSPADGPILQVSAWNTEK